MTSLTAETLQLKELIRLGQTDVQVQGRYDYDDLPVTQPVEVSARVTLSETGATVRGQFTAVVEEPCDRCTDPFSRTLEETFSERFVYDSLTAQPSPGEFELHDEDFYDTIGPDGILDLKDLVYQHVLIALGINRFCGRETCQLQA